MIEKRLVQWYASDAGVDLDIAEREIVLTYVLRILYDEGLLDLADILHDQTHYGLTFTIPSPDYYVTDDARVAPWMQPGTRAATAGISPTPCRG